jgi:hypothetical protein
MKTGVEAFTRHEQSAPRSVCFIPGERPTSTHWLWGWVDHRARLEVVMTRNMCPCREWNPCSSDRSHSDWSNPVPLSPLPSGPRHEMEQRHAPSSFIRAKITLGTHRIQGRAGYRTDLDVKRREKKQNICRESNSCPAGRYQSLY